MLLIKVFIQAKAKLLGQHVEEKEDIVKTDVKEIYVKKTEVNETAVEDDEEEKENPIDISKEVGDNDDKVDNELPDDDFFDAQPNRAGKIKNVKQDSHKNMADAEENPDQVNGDFFDKPMMAKKAQMKIKKKLAKISK